MASNRINRPSVRSSYLLLACLESLGMLTCLLVSMSYTGGHISGAWFNHLVCAECIAFVLVVSLAMAAMGLYHARLRGESSELIARIFLSFALASVAQAAVIFFIPYFDIEPKAVALALGSSFVIVCLIRFGFQKLHASDLMKRRIVVLGSGEKANYIEQRMRRQSDRMGFQILGYVPVTGDSEGVAADVQLPLEGEALEAYVYRNQVEELVIAPDQRRGTLPMQHLYRCRLNGVRVTDITTFVERESTKVPLKMLNPSWMIYSDGYHGSNLMLRIAKRTFDLAISLTLLAIIWPVMLITALLIMLESGPRAPIFYSQERVGRGGVPFWIYKFRSMRVDAEKNGAVWAMTNDQRITAVGAFIRKYRIDELPQILNVLKGDMSFVGPRPERPQFVDELTETIPYYGDRHQVKPGLTGWAQICYAYGASENDALEKLQYDLYYIKHLSILLDTVILIQTAEVVLFGKGAR
ncbi:TIGR03013 family XrtA/PEP-CTERM system glycosyltransferase [Motiliproteus sediminis]|uniref:TIGR03013 family XrtA/PEP-CTERM system glycosyltransferase n=1 Tax=Motiliproteus sediminis TaxID=1468178 RepID=UPI001AEFEE86|nr:TIGR03013 family XrtA/PEP-CTERM system glycosyltransferase [Motiliproteus sediminis]